MFGIKEVTNRNFVLVTVKEPFYLWIKKHSYERYPKDEVLNDKRLFALPVFVNKKNYKEEFIKEFGANIFLTMLNEYEAYCSEEELDNIFDKTEFDEYFDYMFISDCIDVPDIRLFNRKIKTRKFRLRRFTSDDEPE